MTHTTTVNQHVNVEGKTPASLFTRIRQAWSQHLKYRQTVEELERLTDRELQDLNIARCDIPAIAYEAVR